LVDKISSFVVVLSSLFLISELKDLRFILARIFSTWINSSGREMDTLIIIFFHLLLSA